MSSNGATKKDRIKYTNSEIKALFKLIQIGDRHVLMRKGVDEPLWIEGDTLKGCGNIEIKTLRYTIQGVVYCLYHNCHYPLGQSFFPDDKRTFTIDTLNLTLRDGTPWNVIKFKEDTTDTPSLSQPKVDLEDTLTADEKLVGMICGFNLDGTRFMKYNYTTDKDRSALKDLVKDVYKELCSCK